MDGILNCHCHCHIMYQSKPMATLGFGWCNISYYLWQLSQLTIWSNPLVGDSWDTQYSNLSNCHRKTSFKSTPKNQLILSIPKFNHFQTSPHINKISITLHFLYNCVQQWENAIYSGRYRSGRRGLWEELGCMPCDFQVWTGCPLASISCAIIVL